MKPFVLALLLFLIIGGPVLSQRPVQLPAKDRAIEQKINALIGRMTLAEKLGQLQQLDGEGN